MVDDGENHPSPGWDSARSAATKDVTGNSDVLQNCLETSNFLNAHSS